MLSTVSKFFLRLTLPAVGLLAAPAAAQPWTDLGLATPGLAGNPVLEASQPRWGRPMHMTVTSARPFAPVGFMFGVAPIYFPIVGGVLVPNPIVVFNATTDGAGNATAVLELPFSCDETYEFYIQAVIADPAAVEGIAFSNALVHGIGDRVYSDINGDGFADMVVGSPDEGVSGEMNAGLFYVVYGGATGLGTITQRIRQGEALPGGTVEGAPGEDDRFGSAIAVGDYNADGYFDVAVGAHGEDVDYLGSPVNEAGVVHVFYGSPSGLRGDTDVVIEQVPGVTGVPEVFDWFGWTLETGDFDGDGYDDLAVGSPFENYGPGDACGNCGVVQVMWGSASGIMTAGTLWIEDPANAQVDARFGWSLAAGDFDRDGRDDLAVGRPYQDGSAGSDVGALTVLYDYSGGAFNSYRGISQSTGIDGTPISGATEPFDLFAFALAAGDFDADGDDDLAIGVPYEDIIGNTISAAGVVQVLHGSPTGLIATGQQFWDQTGGVLLGSPEIGDYFGYALTAGDFDGDCVTDLAIGAPGDWVTLSGVPRSDVGSVQILFGAVGTGLGASAKRLTGEFEDDFAGWAVAAADFDGDGAMDLATGIPGRTIGGDLEAGAARVYYDLDLAVPTDELWSQAPLAWAVEDGDRFGASLAGSSDRRPY